MTLLQIPLVLTNSVPWDLNETTCTHACSHIQTCIHTNHDKIDTESTWDPKGEREIKKEEKSTHIFFKSKHCKLFTLHSRWCDAHVYVNSLRMEAASFAITLKLLTAFARTQRASSQTRSPTENCREQQKDGEMRGYLILSHGSPRGRVQLSWLMTPPSVSGLRWNLKKIFGESRDFNTISSPPAAAKAWCFLLWMFGSNQSLPDNFEFTTAHLLVPAPSCHEPSSLSQTAFSPTVTHPTDCLFMCWWSSWTLSALFQEIHYRILWHFFFLSS